MDELNVIRMLRFKKNRETHATHSATVIGAPQEVAPKLTKRKLNLV